MKMTRREVRELKKEDAEVLTPSGSLRSPRRSNDTRRWQRIMWTAAHSHTLVFQYYQERANDSIILIK